MQCLLLFTKKDTNFLSNPTYLRTRIASIFPINTHTHTQLAFVKTDIKIAWTTISGERVDQTKSI